MRRWRGFASRGLQCRVKFRFLEQESGAKPCSNSPNFVPNSPDLASISTDSLSSHTPEAVELSGAMNPTTKGADLSWTASNDADLDFYRVRLCAGARYKNDDAITLAELQPGVTNYSVEARFLPGGSTSNVVVSVVLTDGREKQSNTVKFEPPLG